MKLARWLRDRARKLNLAPARAARPTFRLRVESLEDRSVPAVLTVNTTADADTRDADLSLREAIEVVNGTLPVGSLTAAEHARVSGAPGVAGVTDAIKFNILGDGPHTIRPSTFLPIITRPVFIDGYSQPGARRNAQLTSDDAILMIKLDCSALPFTDGNSLSTAGLHLMTTGSTVTGLVVNRFSLGSGIMVEGGGNNHIQGNFIGTNVTGTIDVLNLPKFTIVSAVTPYGIHVLNSHGNWIGVKSGPGDTPNPGERNLVSGVNYGVAIRGTSTNTVVAGNFLGTDATGTRRLGNFTGIGTGQTSGDRIGTDGDGRFDDLERNVISGNRYGIVFTASSDPNSPAAHDITVGGNSIGTDWFGTLDLGNVGAGIGALTGTSNVTIGGLSPALANVIAFNGNDPLYNPAAGRLYGPGVAVLRFARPATGIRILGNSIHDNYGLGIDLNNSSAVFSDGVTLNDLLDSDDGPNRLQNFPVLTSASATGTATTVAGVLTAAPGTYRIEFFSNSKPGHANTNLLADLNRYGEGETFLGSWDVTVGLSGTAAFIAANLRPIPTGHLYLAATATNLATGDTSEFSATMPVPSAGGGGIIIGTGADVSERDVIDAVNQLGAAIDAGDVPPLSEPVTLVLNLNGGDYSGITVSPPEGLTLEIVGASGENVFTGASPALTVTSGTVIVTGVTFVNPTDAPTVLLTGGRLVVRDSVVQETTGGGQPAIRVAGGTLDLGTVAEPGGNALNVNGAGTLVLNETSAAITAFGNHWQADGSSVPPSALVSGPVVWGTMPMVAIIGGSFVFDGQTHPATSASATGAHGESLAPVTVTYSYRDEDGNWHLTGNGGADAPAEPGYYRAVAFFAGDDDYQVATAEAEIIVAYEARSLTDLSKAFKAGRAIPIKLQLLDANGNNVSSSDIDVTAVRLERVNADGSRTTVSPQDTGGANPDNLFRYDAALGGYVFNLSTKGLGAGTYEFVWMAEGDPTDHRLGFSLS